MKKIVLAAVAILTSMAITSYPHAREASPKTVRAVVDADGVQRVAVTGGSYFFAPERIIVKVNMPVELLVKKEPGVVPHDMVVKAPEAGIDFAVKLGDEPKTVRFTPTKAGSYPIYCSKKLLFLESHRDKGMEGMLEVEK
ncbi:cupredoxin domain-containing protein [Geomonas sp. RF6]|uniref:cupredoxin domain-containing protein n=1 Tax=Geomonas sp. RF6 TaxID=2897342 RepID=UPI001E5018C4|nr:cupredoxin domain-containing protein [Geomonas sp. RF6]UFS69353.1 cupredoxin domain-containing protein [Geomonas sp. RF6]